jgi:hypothetical protein
MFYCISYIRGAAIVSCKVVRIAVIKKNILKHFRELKFVGEYDGLKLFVGELMGLSVEVEFISNLNMH